MKTRLLTAAATTVLLSFAAAVVAQDKLPTPPGAAGAGATQPAATSPDAASPELSSPANAKTGAETPAAAEETVTTLEERVEQLEQEVRELKASLLGLQNALAEKDAELHEIVQALSQRDSNNHPILALRSIMKNSDQFRKEMQQAVNESIQREGKLIVDNRTSGVQFLSVNGQTQTINALTRQEFTVPVGTLTTELVGQEAAKNWTIGAPGYRQEIVIRPRSRQVVASPVIIIE